MGLQSQDIDEPPFTQDPVHNLTRSTSGQQRAQERLPGLGNRAVAKHQDPCDSIPVWLHGTRVADKPRKGEGLGPGDLGW